MRDGTAEPVLRGQILRRVRGQEDNHFSCSAEHEQDGQLHPVDPYSAIICDDHTYQSHVGHRSNLSDMVPRSRENCCCVIAVHQIAINHTW